MTKTEPNTVLEINCSDWDDFIRKVRKSRFWGRRIFRGHRDRSWTLSSHWERHLDRMRGGDKTRRIRDVFSDGKVDSHDAIRDANLNTFKKHAIRTPGVSLAGLSDNECWAIGRHHGLTTPLLDWTESPFVAAFFAFLDLADHLNPGFSKGVHDGGVMFGKDPVVIWELEVTEHVAAKEEFELLSAISDTGHRQNAQKGLFTRLNHGVHLDIESFLSSEELAHHLCRYEIPGQSMGSHLAICTR